MANNVLSPLDKAEQAEFHAMMRSARIKARKVQQAFWWNRDISDSYRGLVAELSAIDPLFGQDIDGELMQGRHTMRIEKRPEVKV
jgi:hypothetical protein